MSLLATGSVEDALDIVQESMLKLAQSYAHKPESEWPPLFHQILQSKIRDWYRKQKVRNRWRSFFNREEHEHNEDPLEQAPDIPGRQPEQKVAQQQAMNTLDEAIQQLPLRQQQAFLLRTWEGFDVAETAKVMGCSTGSVKTHYSRAIHTLRDELEKYR